MEHGRHHSSVGRVAGISALVLACVLVALIVLQSGSSYHVRGLFADASGLVSGDDVLIGPVRVGTVGGIALAPDGQAAITLDLDSSVAPLHRGTVLRIAENGLAGSASHYVVLQPAPVSAPTIPSGGTITSTYTYAEVGLDEVFDSLNPLTRAGLRNLVRGEAASIQGRARLANQTIRYLEPVLQSTASVTGELDRYEPAFDGLLTEGAQVMQRLASRSSQLTQLVSATDATTGAIASRDRSLSVALKLLPGTLAHTTRTFAGVRATLNALTPLVQASKPADRRLAPFARALDTLERVSLPAVTRLVALVHGSSTGGSLTELLLELPALARQAHLDFPRLIAEMNQSQSQLDYLREYAPDVVAALSDVGQASSYYDANGHYTRTQPFFNAFGLNAQNQLVPRPPGTRYQGLKIVHGRCPGGAVQASPDGSSPERVPGCDPSTVPEGQ